MKTRYLAFVFMFALIACNDDEEERASIVGTWSGDKGQVKVNYGLIPLYEDNREVFNVTLQLDEDGTAVLIDETTGVASSGTYTLDGNQLTTDVDFKLYDLSGPLTFKVNRLTEERLELQLDTERSVTLPDYGTIIVDIVGYLHFDRN